jgi:hypothetical protein
MPDLTPAEAEAGRRRFRRNLVRVMSVQVIALIALWLVQRHFTP